MARRGNNRRQQQRAQEVGAQVEESIRQDAEDQKLEHVASDELFQIDSKGGDQPKLSKKEKLRQLQKDPLVKSKKFTAEKASRAESERIKKLQQQQNQPEQEPKPTKKTTSTPLWGSDGVVDKDEELKGVDEYVKPALAKKIKPRTPKAPTHHKVKKVEVAAPGQSYHPEFESHQDVMAEAVAQELERQEIRKQMSEPISKGMSEETLQFIDNRASDEELDDENDDDQHDIIGNKKRKQPEQLTRAQRNKRARHKLLEVEQQSKKSEKKLLKQINNVNVILHEVLKDEKASEQKQEVKKLLQEQKLEEEPMVRVGGKLTKLVRETPVSYSEELTGNMRTLKPKGNPLLDRFDSLHKRNMIELGGPNRTKARKIKIIEKK